MNADGSSLTNITNDSSIDDHDPAYSPDGTKIVFSSDGPAGISPFNLWTMNPDGTNRVNLTNDNDFDHYRDYPYYSPDGSQIVFPGKLPRIPKRHLSDSCDQRERHWRDEHFQQHFE